MALFTFLAGGSVAASEDLMLDDFSSAKPTWGTRWEGFTDRVMGGLTEMDSRMISTEGRQFLRLEGQVRTENSGGFLQMRLVLTKGGKALDARGWSGVRLIVRGLKGSYAVHLRTPQNWFPWQFYRSALAVTDEWTEVRLPFASFKGDYGAWGSVDTSALSGIAVVAIGQAFQARLDVREIGLYQ